MVDNRQCLHFGHPLVDVFAGKMFLVILRHDVSLVY